MAKPGQQNQQTPSYEKTTCTRRGLVTFDITISPQSEQQYLDHCPWIGVSNFDNSFVNTAFDINFLKNGIIPAGTYTTTESVDTRTLSNVALVQGTFEKLDEINEDQVRFSPEILQEVERIAYDEVLPQMYASSHPYLSVDGAQEYVENHCTVGFININPRQSEIINLNIGYGTQSVGVDCFSDDAGKSIRGWYTFNPDCEAFIDLHAFKEVGTVGKAGLLGELKNHTLGEGSFKRANVNNNLKITNCHIGNADNCFEGANIQGNVNIVGAKGGSLGVPPYFAKFAEGINFINIDLPSPGNVGSEAFFGCSAKSLKLWEDCLSVNNFAFAGNVFEDRLAELSAGSYGPGCFQSSFITRVLFDPAEMGVGFGSGCFANNDIGKDWAEGTVDSTLTLPETSYVGKNAFYNAFYLDSSNRATLNLNNLDNAVVDDGAFAYNRYSRIEMDTADIYSFGHYSFAFWHGLRGGEQFYIGPNTEDIYRGAFLDWGWERSQAEQDFFYLGWQKSPDVQNTPDIVSLCPISSYSNFRAFGMEPSWDVLGYKARVFDSSVTNQEFDNWYNKQNGRDNDGYWDQQSVYEMQDGTKVYGGDGNSLRHTYSFSEANWIASTQNNWRGITYETDAPLQIEITHPGSAGGDNVFVDMVKIEYPADLGFKNTVETYSYTTGDNDEAGAGYPGGIGFNYYNFSLQYEPWTPSGTWDYLYSQGITNNRYKSGWVMVGSSNAWAPQGPIFLQNGDPMNPVGTYLEVQYDNSTLNCICQVVSASGIKPSNDQASVILGDRNADWDNPNTKPTLTCDLFHVDGYNSRAFREEQGFWGIAGYAI